MSDANEGDSQESPVEKSPGREPVFLLPNAVTAGIGLLVAVHLARQFVLTPDGDENLLVWFAFVPTRLFLPAGVLPGDWLPLLWTPVTHGLLHADWMHLIFNTAWFAIFGTPVARRYGWAGFLVILLASAIAGALAFLLAAIGATSLQILIGASGAVAGLTGAAVRFIFQAPVIVTEPETGRRYLVARRAATIREMLAHKQARAFTVLWLVLNAAVPLLPLLGGGTVEIAWQAHLGGFFAGFFLVPWLERRSAG
ncbi:MAG: hypothetical protein JWR75_1195 [Devosia sp.]|nr:hypothetical protein [Devosia sp.]